MASPIFYSALLPSPPLACAQANTGRGLGNAGVIHEDCKTARVRVEGAVNGRPFAVERVAARPRGRGGRLSFWLAGEERTAQEMRLTQEAIDREVFGAPTYAYRDELFWGQDRLDFLERALAG